MRYTAAALLLVACGGGGGGGGSGSQLGTKFVDVFVEPIKDSVLASATTAGDLGVSLGSATDSAGFNPLNLDSDDLSNGFYKLVDRNQTDFDDCVFVNDNYDLYFFSNSSIFNVDLDIHSYITAEYGYFDTFRYYCEAKDNGFFFAEVGDITDAEQDLTNKTNETDRVFKLRYDTFTSDNNNQYGRFRFYAYDQSKKVNDTSGLYLTRGSQTAALDTSLKTKLSIIHNMVLYPAGLTLGLENINQLTYDEINSDSTAKIVEKFSLVGISKDQVNTFVGLTARFYDFSLMLDATVDNDNNDRYLVGESNDYGCKSNPQDNYLKQAVLGFFLTSEKTDKNTKCDLRNGKATVYLSGTSDTSGDLSPANTTDYSHDAATLRFVTYDNYFLAVEDSKNALVIRMLCVSDEDLSADMKSKFGDDLCVMDRSADGVGYTFGGTMQMTLYENNAKTAECLFDDEGHITCEDNGENYFVNHAPPDAIRDLKTKAEKVYAKIKDFAFAESINTAKGYMTTDLNETFDPQTYVDLLGDIAASGSSALDNSPQDVRFYPLPP